MSDWQYILIEYLIVGVFIAGIAQFRTPAGARRGNITTALAFAAAVALLVYRNAIGYPWVVVPAFAIGGALGWFVSSKITMTRIPGLIALQNGAGGGASLIISLVELYRMGAHPNVLSAVFAVAGALVGGVALSGSAVAAAKLENRMSSRPTTLPAHNVILLSLFGAAVGLALVALGAGGAARIASVVTLAFVTIALGVVFAIRVGGADMPVMISLLNAFSGLAAAFVGITIGNQMLIAAGAMVGSSGTILTLVMAKAMNRSVGRIIAGRPLAESPSAATSATSVNETARAVTSLHEGADSSDEVATPILDDRPPFERANAALSEAKSIIIVPGYGMALAQAQGNVAALASKLEAAGATVRFAVHPVAGRMPGHMHVLLAEAEVEYENLFEMDVINDDFATTDVALIVGACDVVNPAAIEVADTPISGMPILNAHEARTVIVCNLDERPGYSGVPNPLYDDPRSILLFGDAAETIARLSDALDA